MKNEVLTDGEKRICFAAFLNAPTFLTSICREFVGC